jgi:simple sugar transport system substrate-binding protein
LRDLLKGGLRDVETVPVPKTREKGPCRTNRGTNPGLRLLGLLTVASLSLSGCTGSTQAKGTSASPSGAAAASSTMLKSGLGSRATNRKIAFLLSQSLGDPFWDALAQGAKDAAQLYHIDLTLQSSGGEPAKYNGLIRAAVAANSAAIAVVLDEPTTYTAAVCGASRAGIPVMSYNITQPGPVSNCILGFVGQDFEQAGFFLGQRLLQAHPEIRRGDTVFTPVEFPTQIYAIQRLAGVKRAFAAKGIKTDSLGTGIDDPTVLKALTGYLKTHRKIAAVVPLGGTPHRNIIEAMHSVGMKVPVAGFDLSPKVIAGIKSGDIDAAADQQPYVQGFQTVTELALYLDFGLSPATINSGGGGLVERSNVAVVEALAGKTR